jgi:hypothetical protein
MGGLPEVDIASPDPPLFIGEVTVNIKTVDIKNEPW